MNIEKRLRQLHKIQPDPVYTRGSRAMILASERRSVTVSLHTFVIGILRSGSAMAIAGLMLVLVLGGVSAWNLISPFSGFDSRALYAEAQAIDVQIHLADLQYKDGGYGRQSLIESKPSILSAAPVDTIVDDILSEDDENVDSKEIAEVLIEGGEEIEVTESDENTETTDELTEIDVPKVIGVEEALDLLAH